MLRVARKKSPLWLSLDVLAVLVFVLIGRAAHTKGESLAGIASTSWPFLAALCLGWIVSTAWRRPTALYRSGVPAVLFTVAFGMAFRVIAGQGTALAFIFVALFFLGFCMLGWRFSYSTWRALRMFKRIDAIRQVLRGASIGESR